MIYCLSILYLLLVGWLTYESIFNVTTTKRFILKIVCSCMFIAMILYAYFAFNKISIDKFFVLLTGMIFAGAGDILLGIYNRKNRIYKRFFLIGTGLFFLAQMCYITYFAVISGYPFTLLYIFLPLVFGILGFIIVEKLHISSKLVSIFGCIYSLAVSLMLVSGMWYSINSGNLFAFFGGLCFLISDYALAFNYFAKNINKKYISLVTTTLYYVAQLLFIFLIVF